MDIFEEIKIYILVRKYLEKDKVLCIKNPVICCDCGLCWMTPKEIDDVTLDFMEHVETFNAIYKRKGEGGETINSSQFAKKLLTKVKEVKDDEQYKMKYTELQKGDMVIFTKYNDILQQKDYQDGNVIFIDEKRKKVCICYLEGYRSRTDFISYEKVIAKCDPNGKRMKFGVYSGDFVLLEM